MTDVRVERFDGFADEWNSFARAQIGYTHFHQHEWRNVMTKVYGHECIYLVARNAAGALEAVLPLVRVKSALFGHFVVSMPFLNYGGPVGSPSGILAVVSEAVKLARAENVALLQLRSRSPLDIPLPVSHRKVTVLLDLASTPDAMFKRLEAKLRSQVRRPQKEGVTVAFGEDQISGFFTVFAHHMRDLGTPTQPKRLFAAIADTFPKDTWFACAYVHGKPVAAGCGFTFGREFELTWAASLRAYNRIAPNMLLYWSLIERAIDSGVDTFNFGRCTPGTGTHRFKLQWGGREEPLWWYNFAATHEASTPSPDDEAYRWGPRLWRRLPVAVATALGPAIVRNIP